MSVKQLADVTDEEIAELKRSMFGWAGRGVSKFVDYIKTRPSLVLRMIAQIKRQRREIERLRNAIVAHRTVIEMNYSDQISSYERELWKAVDGGQKSR